MPLWLDSVAAWSSIAGLGLTVWAVVAAKGARKAAQEARAAVRAQTLAEVVERVSADAALLAIIAQSGDWGAFGALGTRLVGALSQVVGRYRSALGNEGVTDLGAAGRQLRNALECAADAQGDADAHSLYVRQAEGSHRVLELIARVAGRLRSESDDLRL